MPQKCWQCGVLELLYLGQMYSWVWGQFWDQSLGKLARLYVCALVYYKQRGQGAAFWQFLTIAICTVIDRVYRNRGQPRATTYICFWGETVWNCPTGATFVAFIASKLQRHTKTGLGERSALIASFLRCLQVWHFGLSSWLDSMLYDLICIP